MFLIRILNRACYVKETTKVLTKSNKRSSSPWTWKGTLFSKQYTQTDYSVCDKTFDLTFIGIQVLSFDQEKLWINIQFFYVN